MGTEIKEVLNSPIMREWLNDKYLDINKVESLKETFLNNKPFRHLDLGNFLKIEKASRLLDDLKKEKYILRETPNGVFKTKVNQLAEDSKLLSKQKTIREYYKFLFSKEFISYMNFLTELDITKGDRFFSYLYQDGDFFKPHNDKQNDFKITFILMFSNLVEANGGNLNLYSSKYNVGGHLYLPFKVEKKIITKFNTLVFFEVSDISFHGVDKMVGNELRYNIVSGFS